MVRFSGRSTTLADYDNEGRLGRAPAAESTTAMPTVRRAAVVQMCEASDDDQVESSSPPVPAQEPESRPTQAERLKTIFFADEGLTDFGGQVAALTAAFLAFLGASSALLNDDFWLTPF